MSAVGQYHLSVKSVGRGTRSGGASNAPAAAAYRSGGVVAKAAYRSGEITVDHETGEVHDFTRKGGVVETHILAPQDAPDWTQDRSRLWNEAERAEKRVNGRIATEIEIALPKELNPDQRRELVVGFAQGIVDRHGVVADVAIHQGKDERNIHAHILFSHRELGPDGFGDLANRRTVEKGGREIGIAGIAANPRDVEGLRQEWQEHVNRAYERAGLEHRVDHRSYQRQGIDREPTAYVGPRQTNPDRARQRDWRLAHNQRVAERNQQRDVARDRAREIMQHADRDRAQQPPTPAATPAAVDRTIDRAADYQRLLELRLTAERDKAGNGRDATAEDVAKTLYPKYAKADADMWKLRHERTELNQKRTALFNELGQARDAGQDRWNHMSATRRFAHERGIWSDPAMRSQEKRHEAAQRGIQKLDGPREKLNKRIERQERKLSRMFKAVRVPAELELRERQERAIAARQELDRHYDREREEREQQQERSRDHGMER